MKTFANVAGALMILVIIPMVFSLFKMLKEEDPIRLKYPEIADKLERLDALEALEDAKVSQKFDNVG